eukprot:TRINITY_DN10503_c0_g5_i1.p1 TRINITY_DN10503_c0_g5~~TRINITY_DN10503_c0_g5_i1.p1  ORF type:complete len:411 (-),score=39.76 TRINITY_DN10503_c0_g5_i1:821-2053(-)
MGETLSLPRSPFAIIGSESRDGEAEGKTSVNKLKAMQNSTFKQSSLKALAPSSLQDFPKIKLERRREKKLFRYRPLSSSDLKFSIISKEGSDTMVKAKATIGKAYLLSKLRAAIKLKRSSDSSIQLLAKLNKEPKELIKNKEQMKHRYGSLSKGSSNKFCILRRKSLTIKTREPASKGRNDFIADKELPLGTLRLDGDSDSSLEELADRLNIAYKPAEQNAIQGAGTIYGNEEANSGLGRERIVKPRYSKVHVFNKAASDNASPNDTEIVCSDDKRCHEKLPRKEVNFGSVSNAILQKPKPRKRSSFWGKPKLSLVPSPPVSVVTTPRSDTCRRHLSSHALTSVTSLRSENSISGAAAVKLVKHQKTNANWVLSSGSSTRSESKEGAGKNWKQRAGKKSKFCLNNCLCCG